MNTQPARGMRDFLPGDVARRRYVIGVIGEVYRQYGFEPLETPAVENIDTLLGKYGDEGDKLVFRILKRGDAGKTGEADLALRYDLTVPLARVVAEHRARLPRFFKRYQVQPVWRADRPQKGRFREFYQCDVDAIGSTSPVVEAELLSAAAQVFDRLGFRDVTIRVSHRAALGALLDVAGIPPDCHADAIVAIDKLDKIGTDGVAAELAARGVAPASASALLDVVVSLEPLDMAARLDSLADHLAGHEAGRRAVETLRRIADLTGAGPAAGRLSIDAGLARGLSYYTGAVFEVTVPDLAGSLAGGGRYDNLIGMFLGESVPACGISLGLERILVVMGDRGLFPETLERPPADVLVTCWHADRAADGLALAHELRAAGLDVEVYPDADKLGKQFKYAAARRIPVVVIVGDDEVARGDVAVKQLESGEQTAVPRADVARVIKAQRHG